MDSLWGDGFYGQTFSEASANARHLGEGGNDILSGGSESDLGVGDFSSASVNSEALAGGDFTNGFSDIRNEGSEHVVTGGDDIIVGDGGDDTLVGDFQEVVVEDTPGALSQIIAGNDVIDGGAGNDQIWGDAQSVTVNGTGSYLTGSDTIVFGPGSGLDTVQDFEQGKDLFDISGYGFTDFAGLSLRFSDDGTTTTIDFDGTVSDIDAVQLVNVTGLGASDFVFAVA